VRQVTPAPEATDSKGPARPSERFTFRGNAQSTRHGWLRLTPAYSVHFVRELLAGVDASSGPVLDPFCGTGTTLLACAERGIDAVTIDLNPFLVWLARAKTARYDARAIDEGRALVSAMSSAARARSGALLVPNIHRIERWWDEPVLHALGRAAATLAARTKGTKPAATNLARIAFCRALIEVANVSFGHQSMSFKASTTPKRGAAASVARALASAFDALAVAAAIPLVRSRAEVFEGDSRDVDQVVGENRFGYVVTSPPYSNRMSYIRELRPYMYWLGHLAERSDAGELDWKAIGGTWGAATSRLATWTPDRKTNVPFDGFDRIVSAISATEPILGRYVHRYFEDMVRHARGISKVMLPGGRLHYVVGNSKFYDVMLPAQEIFGAIFEAAGFSNVTIAPVRKRTSKRELYEYLVEAKMPEKRTRARASGERRATT
jgi:SAM-dependent methyltransferase